MSSFQYVTSAGAAKNFDAPDQESAMKMLSTFADRDPSSGIRMVTAPDAAAPPVVQPGQGAAWNAGAPPNGGTGGTGDTPPPPAPVVDPNQAARENAAKDLGYATFDDFMKDVTAKPSQSTQDFYTTAYNAAGLPDLLSKIGAKKDALNSALGTVNDNPWYDEAFRRGEASRLQTLANGDIANLQADYNARLANVHDLVTRETADQAANDKVNATKLNYLHQAVQDSLANQKAADTVAVATQKADAAPPKTISSPTTSNVYQYNPTTKQFEQVQKAVPKPVAPAKPKSPTPPPTDKTVATFTKALANRTTLNKAGTREQFIRQLQAQFPGIVPDDIAAAVYKAYPDHYDGK